MVRYKRYKRRSGTTRSIKMKFQSFMDIHTSASSMQIITISAGGKNLLERCPLQFGAYKYYKLGAVSVKLVPASTLPVDPTGLSIEAGDSTVDPRDQLTPGMMRITNGEDIFEDITGLADSVQHSLYNNMLLDPRWFKWMLQSGVKRYATPRYWQIGQLHQDKWPGAQVNLPEMHADDGDWVIDGTVHENRFRNLGTETIGAPVIDGSSARGLFQTGHTGRLGWMPTDAYQTIGDGLDKPFLASPCEVEVMKIILPKAYKTEYWYRAFITETVYFREPIVQAFGSAYRPLDVFHTGTNARVPTYPITYDVSDGTTGGNYGDD